MCDFIRKYSWEYVWILSLFFSYTISSARCLSESNVDIVDFDFGIAVVVVGCIDSTIKSDIFQTLIEPSTEPLNRRISTICKKKREKNVKIAFEKENKSNFYAIDS